MATNDESMTDKARDITRSGKDKVENAGSRAKNDVERTGRNATAGTNTTSGNVGREVGEGVGGVGGALAGAAIGSVVGPIGTVIGGIAGAVGGWWAGKDVVNAAEGYTGTEDTYRTHFQGQPSNTSGRLKSYDQARPAYQLGYVAAQNPGYKGKSFDQIESDVKRGWTQDTEQQYGSWSNARGYAKEAYDRGGKQTGKGMQGEQTMTRSEEELVIGKRQVQAGEVDLKKTVETEHVKKTVPLVHEEIEVERHAVSGDASARNVEIGEQDIHIQLSAEEAVVNKRVVAKEEVVVKKHAVEGAKNVEADIRKERIDIDKEGRGKDAKGVDRNTERNSDRR
ncbi:MAG: YsnF/AvaK domain-containing protein [Gemmatimonadaceae bacterium]